jgi:hypothetical protein
VRTDVEPQRRRDGCRNLMLATSPSVARLKIAAWPATPSAALACGFYDQAAFSGQFREAAGLNPREYRRAFSKGWARVVSCLSGLLTKRCRGLAEGPSRPLRAQGVENVAERIDRYRLRQSRRA